MIRKRNCNQIKPFNSLFFDFFDDILFMPINETEKSPNYDIIENDNNYVINVSLPGVKKENILIDVENNNLILTAERNENNDLKYNYKRTFFGKYEEIFTLSKDVDKDNITASLSDGILIITIPKKDFEKENNKKRIEIK